MLNITRAQTNSMTLNKKLKKKKEHSAKTRYTTAVNLKIERVLMVANGKGTH